MNIYETVTARILKQLDAGQVPWRKTWATGLPKSLTSGREYRGVNILVLGSSEYTSRYWVTYREAQRLGGHVRKGERATPVIYWKWRTAEEIKKLQENIGKLNLAPCVPFTSAVFNLDQVEGLERPKDDVPHLGHDRLEIAEQMFAAMPDKPEIIHTVTNEPAYSPMLDRILMPHLSQYESADHYYATLFHEVVHSSGHPKRLARFTDAQREQPERYSFEELVAEFGAAFLCGFAGIDNPTNEALQASYIEGWAQVLKKDNRLIVRAAGAAQRAVDYIRGKGAAEEPAAVAA
jgi:antirestriction protein ArdC